jgi:hypothetical protein
MLSKAAFNSAWVSSSACQAVGPQTVEASGVFQHRRIATHLHIAQDVGHALLDGGIGVSGPVQAGSELAASNWLSAVERRAGVAIKCHSNAWGN